jgi:hypothetical protein
MLKDIVEARVLGAYSVHLRFEDGVEGVVDLGRIVRFEGVFAPLRDPREFARMTVNRDLGTICWPGGADLDPDVLYSQVSGQPLPTVSEKAPMRAAERG